MSFGQVTLSKFWQRKNHMQMAWVSRTSHLHNTMPERLRLTHACTRTSCHGMHISFFHILTHLSLKARSASSAKSLPSPVFILFSSQINSLQDGGCQPFQTCHFQHEPWLYCLEGALGHACSHLAQSICTICAQNVNNLVHVCM
jgi:hypothetical protein